jgi:hypothetical protein
VTGIQRDRKRVPRNSNNPNTRARLGNNCSDIFPLFLIARCNKCRGKK